jgi:hypothetical protein
MGVPTAQLWLTGGRSRSRGLHACGSDGAGALAAVVVAQTDDVI